MQRPQVDLAVKRRLKRVKVSIRVFYAKYSANSLRASVPPPTPTPLVGPTNLQILAMRLPGHPLAMCLISDVDHNVILVPRYHIIQAFSDSLVSEFWRI